jgi:hypothetical protein
MRNALFCALVLAQQPKVRPGRTAVESVVF